MFQVALFFSLFMSDGLWARPFPTGTEQVKTVAVETNMIALGVVKDEQGASMIKPILRYKASRNTVLKSITQAVRSNPEKNFFARNKRLSKEQAQFIKEVESKYGWFCGIRILGYNEDPQIVWEVGQELRSPYLLKVESLFSLCISEEDKLSVVDAAQFLSDLESKEDQEPGPAKEPVSNPVKQDVAQTHAPADSAPATPLKTELPVPSVSSASQAGSVKAPMAVWPRPKPPVPDRFMKQNTPKSKSEKESKEQLKKEIQDAMKELEVEDW